MKWRDLPLALRMAIYTVPWVGICYLAVPLGLLHLGGLLGLQRTPPDPHHWIGLLPLILGALGTALSITFCLWRGRGTPFPPDPPTKLITSGPYAHCRNPLIASQFILALGEALFLGASLMLCLMPMVFLVTNIYLKLAEERTLVTRFGWQYAQYKDRVPMWLPRLRPFRPTPRGVAPISRTRRGRRRRGSR